MEIHRVGKQSFSDMGNILKKAGFDYDYSRGSTYSSEFGEFWLVHAINPDIA
jgi:hypothetical protein